MTGFRINKREYAWGDGQLRLLGRTVAHVIAVEYNEKQDKEHLFAAGRHAHAIQRGRVQVDGSFTFYQSEVIALQRAAKEAGKNSILDISFDFVMSYISEEGVTTTDIIYGLEFTENIRSIKEGDMKMEIPLPFLALSIKHNAKQ